MATSGSNLEAQSLSMGADPLPVVAPLSPRPPGPPRDSEWADGTAHTRTSGSRRRKPVGQGQSYSPQTQAETQGNGHHGWDQSNSAAVPVAPEAPEPPPAPKGPPISYRDPYTNGLVGSRSFADRARDLADEGTHLPSGRTPEPSASFKDHTPFVQAMRPDVVQPQRAEISEEEAIPRAKYQQPQQQYPQQYPQPPPQSQQAQQTTRIPFGESPPANRSAPRNEPRVGTRPDDSTNAAPAARMGSVRGNSGPQKLDWAVDHSPLQRLEVKLNDLSKEEKRARMEAAEQRHRDREKARKQRDSQTLEEGSRAASRGNVGNDSARSGANETRTRRRSLEQNADASTALTQGQTGRRVVSDTQGPIASKTTPRADQHRGSRIPRPVEALAAAGAAAGAADAIHGVGRSASQSKRQRTSLDSAVPRLGGDSNPLTRHYDGSVPVAQSDRRRSTDDRGVRFHPFDESINKKYAAQGSAPRDNLPPQQTALYTERVNNAQEPTPPHALLAHKGGPKYQIPPQSVAGGKAREVVGFGGDQPQAQMQDSQQEHGRHHFMPHLHRHQQQSTLDTGAQAPRHLDEWRQGGTARLQLIDLTAKKEPQKPGEKAMPWWESPKGTQKRGSRSSSQPPPEVEYFDGANEDTNQPTIFDPPLFMKCGPLLRYTGMKRDKLAPPAGAPAPDRETWRGSVMIVTVDADSVYEPAPTLRLFHQPMDLLAEPPMHVTEGKEPLPSEYVDPVAGMPKISRDGSTVYVKPAEDFEEGTDYSRDETDNGLFEKMRTANVPTGYGRPDTDGGESPVARSTSAGRRAKAAGRFREVKGIRLHAERGVTFWRFNLEVELGDKQARIAYRINKGASVGFWVPARGQSMNIMFHSCNGFSSSVKPGEFGGPDPLWRDVLNAHQTKPFHVMIGGGDQIYNDRVTTETTIFQQWLETKNPSHKREAPFSIAMRDELESFYLNRYAMWFSQGMFGMANSQIPMVNIWDDHDIIDGFGSYPDSFMSSPVFSGLGAVAFKYYMLYQHQSVPDELEADEPSWLLGASPGPYINYLSRNIFVSLGKHVAFLGLDCRTERRRDEILSENSYDKIFDRCRREIVASDTKHLIVLLGVPIAYPRLEWLENILTSRVMDPVKALSRLGVLGNLTNKFDGGYEILDDLDDHWTAKHHKDERRWVIEELQELAAEKSVRITILGGDVHLAAVGQFYSNKKLNIPKDRDHRYMPNIVSSAIVNTPPTDMMADFINRRDKKVHHLDAETDEDMIPMFTHDVDGKRRNNKKLLPRRNWCSISEYAPGMTPPPSPPLTASESGSPESEFSDEQGPRRSFSLGNSRPAQLLRRLSSANKGNRDDLDPSLPYSQQQAPAGDDPANDSYFPPESGTARVFNKMQRKTSAPPIPTRPTSQFHRRPTNLSEKAAKKGNLPDGDGEISLQGGLDIRINCEIKQGDPIGGTESYRLLVPALWYTGDAPAPVKTRRPSMLQRLSSVKAIPFAGRGRGQESESDFSESEATPPQQFQPRPQPSAAAPFASGPGSGKAALVGGQSAPSSGRSAPAVSHNATYPMGNSVSVESLPQRPRRQSLLQRFGSLRDKIQPNRSRDIDDTYSEYTNDEYAPNDDAAMMQQGSMARQSRPPVTGSIDSVSRKPRRPSIAERFGSIGRRLSQMGRRKDKDWYSETGSYTGSETETEAEYQSDYVGSGDLSRPGRQPMTSPPGSRGQPMASPPVSRGQTMASPPVARPQPPVVHQKPQKVQKQTQFTAPAAAPIRTSSQRATTNTTEEIPDPFKPRPKVAMSPPPQTQQAQFYPPPQPQDASTYGGSTDAMVGSRQAGHVSEPVAQRSTSQRASTGQAYDNRRSGGVFAPPQPHVNDEDDDESATDDSELDSIDDLDSLKAAAKNRQRRRNSKNMGALLGPEVDQAHAQGQASAQRRASMRAGAPASGGGLKKKDISKFFGEDDPAAGEGMRRRVTDPGMGGGKRDSLGYSGVEAWNGSGKKWWKLGK